MKKHLTNQNGGMNRRNFVGVGLALAATSVLAPTGAAQNGVGRSGTTGKTGESIGRRSSQTMKRYAAKQTD